MVIYFSFILAPKVPRKCAYCTQIICSHVYRRFGVEVEGKGKAEKRTPWVVWSCEDCTAKQATAGVYGEILAERLRALIVTAAQRQEKADAAYEARLLADSRRQTSEFFAFRKMEMLAAGMDITEFVYHETFEDAEKIARSMGYRQVSWDSEANRTRRERRRNQAVKDSLQRDRLAQMVAARREGNQKAEK